MQSQGYRAPLPAPPLAVVSIRGEEARAGSATLSLPKSPDKDRQDPQGPKGVILSLSLSPSESSLSCRKGRRKPARFIGEPAQTLGPTHRYSRLLEPWHRATALSSSWSASVGSPFSEYTSLARGERGTVSNVQDREKAPDQKSEPLCVAPAGLHSQAVVLGCPQGCTPSIPLSDAWACPQTCG